MSIVFAEVTKLIEIISYQILFENFYKLIEIIPIIFCLKTCVSIFEINIEINFSVLYSMLPSSLHL